MSAYHVRHIICPLCDGGFTHFIDRMEYTVEGHDGYWEKLKCPKCQTELFVSATEQYALLADDVVEKQERLILN